MSQMLYTRSQLIRLHKHLLHPSVQKLYNLLRGATPDNLPSDTRRLLQDISHSCKTCARFATRPITFKIRDKECLRFTQNLLLDIMYLPGAGGKQHSVLHVLDVGTSFCSAAFLPALDVGTVWNTFLTNWFTMYEGYSESPLTDQSSVFVSAEWTHACETNGIHLRHTGTESHNSLGACEKYHPTLRIIYNKVRLDFLSVPATLALQISVKAMNDCTGPDELVPSLLVFGVTPRLPYISPKDFPSQKEKFRALVQARKQYERLVSQSRVRLGILRRPPPAADRVYAPGDFLFV